MGEGDKEETLRRAGAEIKTENKEMTARRVVRMRVERPVRQWGGLYGRMPSTWWYLAVSCVHGHSFVVGNYDTYNEVLKNPT